MKRFRVVSIFAGLAMIAGIPAFSQQRYLLEAPASAVSSLTAQYGLTLVRTIADEDPAEAVYLVTAPGTAPSDTLIAAVSANPAVEEFEADETVESPEVGAEAPLPGSTAGIGNAATDDKTVKFAGSMVRSAYAVQPANDAISLGDIRSQSTGAGIVAVIDTGVDPAHPALVNVLVPGYDFVNGVAGIPSELNDLNATDANAIAQSAQANPNTKTSAALLNQSTVAILDQSTVAILDGGGPLPGDFGHGTMVAGLIHLVAPSAKIMPIKAFQSNGTANLSDIISSIYFATDHGANVINMSFSQTAPSKALAAAISYATSKGVASVASAGNDGKPEFVYPAGLAYAIGVASINNDGVPSLFSNYGVGSVFMAAPGEGLITTYPGNNYAAVWGTSFSAALVSGAAAVFYYVKPTIGNPGTANALAHGDSVPPIMGNAALDLQSSLSFLSPGEE